jgi:PAS domain S-box-containing protein
MLRNILPLPFLLLFAAALFGSPVAFVPPSSISVILDDNYPPYIFRDSAGNLQGILPDDWKLWEHTTGVRVDLKAMSWDKALTIMESGGADVIDTIFSNADRAKIYRFTKPYTRIDVPIFVHRSLQGVGSPENLRGFAVGVKRGDACIDVLRSHGVQTFREFDSYEEIVSNAVAGNLRVFVMDAPPAMYFLIRSSAESAFRVSEPLYTGEFHRAVRIGNEKLLAFVEEGFRKIPENRLAAVQKRWLGTPLFSRAWLPWIFGAAGVALLFLGILVAWNLLLRRQVRNRTAQLSATLDHLRESADRVRTIFDSMNDAIFVHSAEDYSILDVNDRMCEMFGLSREEALNKRVVDISAGISPWTQADAERWLRKSQVEGPQLFLWKCKKQSGELFWTEVNMRSTEIDGRKRIIVAVRDVNDREIARQELSNSRALLEAVFERSPVPVALVMATDRSVRYASRSCLELLGIPQSRFTPGTRMDDFFGEWNEFNNDGTPIPVEDLPISRALEGEVIRGRRILVRRKDGGESIVVSDAVPIRNAEGDLLAGFLIFPDITEIIMMEREIRELNRDLENKVRERTRKLEETVGELESFSYSVSHDLRAPLRAIDGFSHILSEEFGPTMDEKARRYVQLIGESAVRMGQLIDGVLSLSRLSATPMRLEALDLSVLATEIFRELSAQEPGRTIRFSAAPGATATGDRRLLRSVLENLLSNALKFTAKRAEAEISFGFETVDGEKRFFVRDNGCGFDMKYVGKLFGTFQRLHPPAEYEGNGIGLANVKRVVARHGGRVWAVGKTDVGATFYFTLPANAEKGE